MQAICLIRLGAAAGVPVQLGLRPLAGIVGWLMLSVAIYLLNGVTDRAGDRVNGSRRPIASGALPLDTALSVAVLLAVGGAMACVAVDSRTLPLVAGYLALGWAYSAGPALKNSPLGSAAVIAGGIGLTYAAGWFAGETVRPARVAFGLAMTLWVSLACMAKDFSDTEGDRLAGRRTWPVLLGARRAAGCLQLCSICGSLAMVAAAVLVDRALWPVALVVLAGSVVLSRRCVVAAGSEPAVPANRQARRGPYRAFMVTQYGAHLTLLLTTLIG